MQRGRGRGRGRGGNRGRPIPENDISEHTKTGEIDFSGELASDVTNLAAEASQAEADAEDATVIRASRQAYPAVIKYLGANLDDMTQLDSRLTFEVEHHIPHLHLVLAVKLGRSEEGAVVYSFPETMLIRISYRAVQSMMLTEIDHAVYHQATNKTIGAIRQCFRLDLKLSADKMVMERVIVDEPHPLLKGLVEFISAKVPKKEIQFEVYIHANRMAQITQQFEKLQSDFENNKVKDPLQIWVAPNQRNFNIQIGQFLRLEDRPSYPFPVHYAYENWFEYMIYLVYSTANNHDLEAKKVQNDSITRLRLIEISSCGDRRYWGVLNNFVDESQRLTEGDTIILYGVEEEDDYEDGIAGTVTNTPPGFPPDRTYVILNVRWEKCQQEYVTFPWEITPITAAQCGSYEQALNALIENPGCETKIHRIMDRKVYSRMITSFRAFDTYSALDKYGFDKMVLAKYPAFVPKVDIYGVYGIKNPLEHMSNLNSSQKRVVIASQNTPGGVLLIQGPPGTGKTYLIIQMLKPFIKAGKRSLLTSATNDGVTDLAERIHEACIEQNDHSYAVRFYSIHVEEKLTKLPATLVRPRDENARPPIHVPLTAEQQEALEQLEVAKLLQELHDEYFKTKFEGVHDRRVQNIELSVGYRMLQRVGIIPTNGAGPKATPEKYAGFCEYYDQYRLGEKWEKEDQIRFTVEANELRHDIIREASVIITTPTLAISDTMARAARPHILILDEACRQVEAETIAIRGTFQCTPMIMVGDFKQGGPFVHENSNMFKEAMRMCLMSRLVGAGFTYHLLTTQYRMVPQLSRIINLTAYNGKLEDHESVLVRNRPDAKALQQYNHTKFGKQSSIILLDLKLGETKRTHSGSRYNEVYIQHGILLIKDLVDNFPQARIAYLAFYQAQVYLARTALRELCKEGNQYFQVTIDTVDRVQGREWDIVIIDFLIMNQSAGFMSQMSRCNVALSRARIGMYVQSNRKAVEQVQNARTLRKFLAYTYKGHVVIDQEPANTYYKIAAVDMDAAELGKDQYAPKPYIQSR